MRELVEVQCYDGNWNFDPYMHGMANGMILGLAIMEGEQPDYLEAPEYWLADYSHEHAWRDMAWREIKGPLPDKPWYSVYQPESPEPEAFIIQRISGTGYGPDRKIVDIKKYDPRYPGYFVEGAKKNYKVTPLYTQPPAPAVPEGWHVEKHSKNGNWFLWHKDHGWIMIEAKGKNGFYRHLYDFVDAILKGAPEKNTVSARRCSDCDRDRGQQHAKSCKYAK